MKILGIDPSLCKTGWGLIEVQNDNLIHISHGVIKIKPTMRIEARLAMLFDSISTLLVQIQPDLIALEETFCGVNSATNIRLGFASGAIMASAGKAGIELRMYATRLIKRSVTGNGAATKAEVRQSVLGILNLGEIDSLDSSDALAVAIASKYC